MEKNFVRSITGSTHDEEIGTVPLSDLRGREAQKITADATAFEPRTGRKASTRTDNKIVRANRRNR